MKYVRQILCFALTLMASLNNVVAADPKTQKTLYLTFDDGPLLGTENVIDTLNAENVQATMFMVGLHAEASPYFMGLVKKAKASSVIEVANHSYSHAYDHYRHFYRDAEAVVKDIERNARVLGLTDHPGHVRLPGRDVFRMPGLSRDDPFITKSEDRIETIDDDDVYKAGFYLYGWDLEWAHETTGRPIQSVEHLLKEIEERFAKGDTVKPDKLILLMHDEMFRDVFDGKEKLKALIAGLKKAGYRFDTIKNY